MEKLKKAVQDFEDALLSIDRIRAASVFESLRTEELDFSAFEKVMMQALENIGEKWESGSVSLAQVYMSGIICEELITKAIPERESQAEGNLRLAIGVLQDQHGLGKRIVTSVLRAGGFSVLDLGQGLHLEEMARRTMENQVDILLISTLMLHSALEVKKIREQLAEAGFQGKIIVGGAPFRLAPDLWKEVGADYDGKNASHVITLIREIAANKERGILE